VTEFGAILKALIARDVEFVVVGGVSAALQGAPVVTIDLDLVHSREQKNVSRLVTALADLEARYRVPGLTNRTPEPSHFRPPGISFS